MNKYFVSVPLGPKAFQGYEVPEALFRYISHLEHLVAFHDVAALREIYPEKFNDINKKADDVIYLPQEPIANT